MSYPGNKMSPRTSTCSVPLSILCCIILSLVACESPADDGAAGPETFQQWKLPGKLREISGLALSPDQRLFAVADEEAIVYQLDYDSGRMIKAFALGDPTVRGDFEGIAITGTTIWLMTSDGLLYSFAEGNDGDRVRFERFDSGLGSYCELEGLAEGVVEPALFLACKKTSGKSDKLKIFHFEIVDGSPRRVAAEVIPEQMIVDSIRKKHLHPSALVVDPATGNRVILASNHKTLARISTDGELIDVIILPGKKRHRQPEGIAITTDGRLLIADEGGNGRARLAVYRWTKNGLMPQQ